MKKIILLFIILIFSINNTYGMDIFDTNSEVIYCNDGSCGLEEGTDIVKDGINDIEKEKTASEYIQGVVLYILTFITIIAVLYIIYAGFKVLTSAGDEEKAGESKKIIISVFIGILIIWLAYAIVKFFISIISA